MPTAAARRRRAPSHTRRRTHALVLAAALCGSLMAVGVFLSVRADEQPIAVSAEQPAAPDSPTEPSPDFAGSWRATPGAAARHRHVTDGTWMTADGGLEPVAPMREASGRASRQRNLPLGAVSPVPQP